MADKADEKRLPLLNTTISELPVNDLPIDCLTREKTAVRERRGKG
jgi:hypothetical protein